MIDHYIIGAILIATLALAVTCGIIDVVKLLKGDFDDE